MWTKSLIRVVIHLNIRTCTNKAYLLPKYIMKCLIVCHANSFDLSVCAFYYLPFWFEGQDFCSDYLFKGIGFHSLTCT